MASFDKNYFTLPHTPAILELHSSIYRCKRTTVRVIKNSLNGTMIIKKYKKVSSNKASLEPSFVGSISSRDKHRSVLNSSLHEEDRFIHTIQIYFVTE